MDRSVVFLDLKGGCAPCDKPLMLRPILFCPVLTWVAQELTVDITRLGPVSLSSLHR